MPPALRADLLEIPPLSLRSAWVSELVEIEGVFDFFREREPCDDPIAVGSIGEEQDLFSGEKKNPGDLQ